MWSGGGTGWQPAFHDGRGAVWAAHQAWRLSSL